MIYPPEDLEIFIILINYELPSNYITSIFNLIRNILAVQNLSKFVLKNKSNFNKHHMNLTA